MTLTCSLGVMCIVVSLWSKFNQSKYRILRAGEFNNNSELDPSAHKDVFLKANFKLMVKFSN